MRLCIHVYIEVKALGQSGRETRPAGWQRRGVSAKKETALTSRATDSCYSKDRRMSRRRTDETLRAFRASRRRVKPPDSGAFRVAIRHLHPASIQRAWHGAGASLGVAHRLSASLDVSQFIFNVRLNNARSRVYCFSPMRPHGLYIRTFIN